MPRNGTPHSSCPVLIVETIYQSRNQEPLSRSPNPRLERFCDSSSTAPLSPRSSLVSYSNNPPSKPPWRQCRSCRGPFGLTPPVHPFSDAQRWDPGTRAPPQSCLRYTLTSPERYRSAGLGRRNPHSYKPFDTRRVLHLDNVEQSVGVVCRSA
jgi:hypothetical protein